MDSEQMATVIQTENATYLLDTDRQLVTRLVRAVSGRMRRDGEPLHVREWDEPCVGLPWRMLVKVREDDMMTLRETSPVVRVMSA